MRAYQSPIHQIPLTLQVDDEDEFSLQCIDPRLLCISIEAPYASTLDTKLDLRVFPPPTPAPDIITLLSVQPIVHSLLLF